MKPKFNSLRIGDLEILIDRIYDIEYHSFSHITIRASSGAVYDLNKDNYPYSDWYYFVTSLKRVFVL